MMPGVHGEAARRGRAACANANVVLSTLLTFVLVAWVSGTAKADDWHSKLVGGSGGGNFTARCDQGEYLVGIEAGVGGWFDSVRPLCAKPDGPMRRFRAQFGGDGGAPRSIACPPDAPVITYLNVIANGPKTVVVDHLYVRCGAISKDQAPLDQRAALEMKSECSQEENDYAVCGSGKGRPNLRVGSMECPGGMLGVGLYGRYGMWLDALGLICAELPAAAPAPFPPPVSGTPMPPCPNPKVRSNVPPFDCVCPESGSDFCVEGDVKTQDDLKRLPSDIIGSDKPWMR